MDAITSNQIRSLVGGETRVCTAKQERSARNQHRLYSLVLLVLLIYFFQQPLSSLALPEISTEKTKNNDHTTKQQPVIDTQQQLSCQAGEQRHFNYESSTRVWGSSSKQQVQLRATLRVRCMESPTNSTLKYLVEILSVDPAFGDKNHESEGPKKINELGKLTQRSNLQLPLGAHAEPVLEEVGEAISVAATRVRRSVSGWFNKTWSSVKDFFVNIFNSSERTTISRDQALGEHGVDIANQCKASGKSPKNGMLPLDESVFDDLDTPEYYMGASTDALGTGYVFDGSGFGTAKSPGNNNAGEDDDDLGMEISFFDDPKPQSRSSRSKREQQQQQPESNKSANANKTATKTLKPEEYERQLKLPFVFVQSRLGRIIEVRFSHEEIDLGVKNFKRHLCDLFTTNLDKSKSQTNELSPIGKHKTKYVVDSSSDSLNVIKDSLMKSSQNSKDDKQSQQLVRALAVVSSQSGEPVDSSNNNNNNSNNNNGVASRDPNETGIQGDTNTNGLSVLRSINSTSVIQLSSRAFQHSNRPDIDQMQVSVKQVQQINDGRLIGSAGQLGMSLLQMGDKLSLRPKRSSGEPTNNKEDASNTVGDIADLLQVSTSFAIQLVPIKKLGSFADVLTDESKGSSSKSGRRMSRAAEATSKISKSNDTLTTKPLKREPLVIKVLPDSPEFHKVMREMRQIERDLDFSATSLVAESSREDGQLQRLEILRDQIQMRLNEEILRNRIHRMASISGQQVAAASIVSPTAPPSNQKARPGKTGNDIGLGLTQLVLGNGITSKRKGSIYETISETIELELALNEAHQDGSMTRMMLDTIRVDKMRTHCKSSIATLDEIQNNQSNKLIELREPFNVTGSSSDDLSKTMNRIVNNINDVSTRNRRKLDYCKRILEIMLRLNERRAADLVVELIDDCNERLIAGARQEELGHGPTSKYYRDLRQQFTELLVNINKPGEILLDKLMARLDYAKLNSDQAATGGTRRRLGPEPEFIYVPKESAKNSVPLSTKQQRYNKSVLYEEDNFNNNDGAGSLVMTITSLANKNSIKTSKRLEVANKLLQLLKGTSCSLFDGPDLDIIESMGNYWEAHDDIVGKVIHLARRCRHQDQYVIACVHGLQGQLSHQSVQKFLTDQLLSSNASCTLKSEIVYTLIGAITAEELRASSSSSASDDEAQLTWPAYGMNKVDETLLELTGLDPSKEAKNRQTTDKRCLSSSVSYYMGLKRSADGKNSLALPKEAVQKRVSRNRNRNKRAILNESSFWDEATCKRWSLPADPPTNTTVAASPTDLLDELDDNSILNAIAQHSKRNSRRNQNLVEREAEAGNSVAQSVNPIVRRRHKCSASKTFGPKNAQAILKAEIVNDLVGSKDENKFLARFRLATNFLGNRIDVGRMYLWHQRQVTRAHANVLGKSLWDTSHGCEDKAPGHFMYMPLFDFNLWLVKVSVGLNLQAEMGFHSSCEAKSGGSKKIARSIGAAGSVPDASSMPNDELELYPKISLRASGEASAKFVVARAGMSLASHYSYQGNIRVSRQPESCMTVSSAHHPMNVTFSSWFQLFDSDCHYWGSRNRAEPQATRWKLSASKPSIWIQDECLAGNGAMGRADLPNSGSNSTGDVNRIDSTTMLRPPMNISP